MWKNGVLLMIKDQKCWHLLICKFKIRQYGEGVLPRGSFPAKNDSLPKNFVPIDLYLSAVLCVQEGRIFDPRNIVPRIFLYFNLFQIDFLV